MTTTKHNVFMFKLKPYICKKSNIVNKCSVLISKDFYLLKY